MVVRRERRAVSIRLDINRQLPRNNYKCTARGGPGTLDNLFNTNSELVLAYNAATYDFALSAHN